MLLHDIVAIVAVRPARIKQDNSIKYHLLLVLLVFTSTPISYAAGGSLLPDRRAVSSSRHLHAKAKN